MKTESSDNIMQRETTAPGPDGIRLAQIGYEAYAQFTGGKTFDGRDMPTWHDVVKRDIERGTKVGSAWEAAGKAQRAWGLGFIDGEAGRDRMELSALIAALGGEASNDHVAWYDEGRRAGTIAKQDVDGALAALDRPAGAA